MLLLFVAVGLVLGCFGFVLLRGAPYLPTLTKQVGTAFDLLDLKPGQTVLELGCGDGKLLIAAAERGINAVGYELNPILALIAWLRTRRFKGTGKGKVTGKVKVVCGDFWTKQWPPAEGIFVFLLDRYMEKLDTKIVQSYGASGKSLTNGKPASSLPVKLVSFAFQVPGRQASVQKDGLFLYEYQ